MKFGRGVLRWTIGAIVNICLVILFYLLLSNWKGWSIGDCLIVTGIIQMFLTVPAYIRDINVMPQDSVGKLRGDTTFEAFDSPKYIGLKTFPVSFEEKKELKGIKGYLLRRSVYQQMVYFICMIGAGIWVYIGY